jgi:flagellar motor switch protein FliN/FliY
MDSHKLEKETLDSLLKKVQGSSGAPPSAVADTVFPPLVAFDDAGELAGHRPRADLFRAVHLKVRVELGRVTMALKDVLRLTPGAVIDLEKLADDPVELYVDDLLVARGEVLVVNDCFCVRITEVFAQHGVEDAGA